MAFVRTQSLVSVHGMETRRQQLRPMVWWEATVGEGKGGGGTG